MPESRIIKLETLEAIFQYLRTRPYMEVNDLIVNLQAEVNNPENLYAPEPTNKKEEK